MKYRERDFYRPTRPPFITQYERDLAAIRSADRFRKACIFFALFGGLGLAAFVWWVWL
jgi:hypothetical protein